MLQVSVDLLNLITAKLVAPSILVKLAFSSGSILMTDAPREIPYNGDLYLPDAGIKQVSPPKASPELSRDLFEVMIGDVDNSLRTLLDLESIGVPVYITSAFTIVETGLLHNEFISVYKGKISSVSWEINEDEPKVTIQCSGPLSKLHQVTNRATTENSQKLHFPLDTSMDFSSDSETVSTIKWGGV